jgi:hypothetical protein
MRPVIYSSDALVQQFYERKVLTKEQILKAVGCSPMTAWRLLKSLGYLTSYNFNARYYTLRAMALFNEHGLWSYRKVRFSIYGSLPITVKMLITKSSSGLTMADLRDLLQVNVTPTLIRLHLSQDVSREKVGPVYLYLSNDVSERQSQLRTYHHERQKILDRQTLPASERIIAVLVELVKEVTLDQEQVFRRLRSKGISITKDEIQLIWSHYDLAKKKRV